MKKLLFSLALCVTSFGLSAQSETDTLPEKETQYSILWGLFESDDYREKDTFEIETPKVATEILAFDTVKYEQKSLLWGAVQWTQKKEISPVKNEENEH